MTREDFEKALLFLGIDVASGVLRDIAHARKSINAAYRKLARELHPDAGGDSAEFVKLGAARDTALAGIAAIEARGKIRSNARAWIFVNGVRVGMIHFEER